jgi:Flp pilus assembly protein TadB
VKRTPPPGEPRARRNAPRAQSSTTTTAVISIVALVVLMAYSIVLLTLGYSPQITLVAAAVLCGLAVKLVRRTLASTGAPQLPSTTEVTDGAPASEAGMPSADAGR